VLEIKRKGKNATRIAKARIGKCEVVREKLRIKYIPPV
jgi:hypothetical protein